MAEGQDSDQTAERKMFYCRISLQAAQSSIPGLLFSGFVIDGGFELSSDTAAEAGGWKVSGLPCLQSQFKVRLGKLAGPCIQLNSKKEEEREEKTIGKPS